MFSKFKSGHNTAEATKNICCAKDEGIVDHGTVIRWFKKFCPVARTSTIKQGWVDQRAVHQAIEANLAISTWSVWWALHWGKSSNQHSECLVSSASHGQAWFILFITLVKASKAAKLFHISKILQNFLPNLEQTKLFIFSLQHFN